MISVFLDVNKMNGGCGPLNRLKMRACHQKDQGIIRGLKLSWPLLSLQGRERGLETELVNHQWPMIWRVSGLINMFTGQEGGVPQLPRVRSSCALDHSRPHTLYITSSGLFICNLYIKPADVSKVIP